MDPGQWRSIGISGGLITANIVLMYLLSFTAVTGMVAALFNTLILGVLVFGALLTGGAYLAERGVKDGDTGTAAAGVALLQTGYGVFGGFVLSILPATLRLPATGITLLLSVVIATAAGLYVYRSDRNFDPFRRYASYCFLGVLGMALLGTFAAPIAIIAFLLALLGFLFYLVYEIADLEQHPQQVWLNAVGIYTAFMGVFIHILQIVVRLYGNRR